MQQKLNSRSEQIIIQLLPKITHLQRSKGPFIMPKSPKGWRKTCSKYVRVDAGHSRGQSAGRPHKRSKFKQNIKMVKMQTGHGRGHSSIESQQRPLHVPSAVLKSPASGGGDIWRSGLDDSACNIGDAVRKIVFSSSVLRAAK